MNRPQLRPVSKPIIGRPGEGFITMSIGQWDGMLKAAYDMGWCLLELDENERFVQAYQKETKR